MHGTSQAGKLVRYLLAGLPEGIGDPTVHDFIDGNRPPSQGYGDSHVHGPIGARVVGSCHRFEQTKSIRTIDLASSLLLVGMLPFRTETTLLGAPGGTRGSPFSGSHQGTTNQFRELLSRVLQVALLRPRELARDEDAPVRVQTILGHDEEPCTHGFGQHRGAWQVEP